MSRYVSAWIAQLERDPNSFLRTLDFSPQDIRRLMRSFQAIVWRTSGGAANLGDEDAFSNVMQVLGACYMSKRDEVPCKATFDFKHFSEPASFDFALINDNEHMHNLACKAFGFFFTHYQRHLGRFGRLGPDKSGDLGDDGEPGIEPDDLPTGTLSPEQQAYLNQVNAILFECMEALPEPGKSIFRFKKEGCTLEWLVTNKIARNISAAHAALQVAFEQLVKCLKSKGIDQSDFLIDGRVFE